MHFLGIKWPTFRIALILIDLQPTRSLGLGSITSLLLVHLHFFTFTFNAR